MQKTPSKKPLGRLAINGMGRIGRTLFRVLLQKDAIHSLTVLNDVMPKENLLYLLKYDSIRGILPIDIIPTDRGFSVDGHEIIYFQKAEIGHLPWREHAVEIVLEATGQFTHSSEASEHLTQGAKRVLLSTYGKDIPTSIWKVNNELVRPDTKIVSPGDCTINCVAPLIHIMRGKFGVSSLHINVIQGYTTRQELLDGPYKGLRRGRAAGHSIIPFEVNITPVLEKIFPSLNGKIESMSTRVPVPCGAMAELSICLNEQTNAKTVNSILEEYSKDKPDGSIALTYDPIVSADILGNPNSVVIDGSLTRVTNGHHLRLLAWFDNEWGYSNRLWDWLCYLQTDLA